MNPQKGNQETEGLGDGEPKASDIVIKVVECARCRHKPNAHDGNYCHDCVEECEYMSRRTPDLEDLLGEFGLAIEPHLGRVPREEWNAHQHLLIDPAHVMCIEAKTQAAKDALWPFSTRDRVQKKTLGWWGDQATGYSHIRLGYLQPVVSLLNATGECVEVSTGAPSPPGQEGLPKVLMLENQHLRVAIAPLFGASEFRPDTCCVPEGEDRDVRPGPENAQGAEVTDG